MMERKSFSCYLHTGYSIKFIQSYRNKKYCLSEIFHLLYQVYDISSKNPSFLEKKFIKIKSPSANAKGLVIVWLPYWTRLELLRGDTGIDNTKLYQLFF